MAIDHCGVPGLMLLNPNDCCAGCLPCKDGLEGRIFRINTDGFTSTPAPGEGDESPYFRDTDVENLNAELVFNSEDFISDYVPGLEPGMDDDGHSVCGRETGLGVSSPVVLGTFQRQEFRLIEGEWVEWGDPWPIEVSCGALIVLDKTADVWRFRLTFDPIHGLATNLMVTEENITGNSFECEDYTGEMEKHGEWDWPGDTSALTGTLAIETEE